MEKWDVGLTVIGTVVLGTAIAVGVPIGWAYLFTTEPPKAADWLSFAGSLLSAGVALFAARIAWRAVQRQIDVQREANLLGVLTREEDRLELELHALETCITLLFEVKRADRGRGAGDFRNRLSRHGISSDLTAMRETVRLRVPVGCPPNIIHNVSVLCAKLAGTVDQMAKTMGLSDGAGGITYPPAVTTAVRNAVLEIDAALDQMLIKRTKIDAILPSYRARIEKGLSEAPATDLQS